MRSNPAEYEFVAPRTLSAVLALLAEPGAWTPIAGGTDVMVLYAAGKLREHRLISLQHIQELRFVKPTESELRIGATCTYTEIRRHKIIQEEFPLLATAASWTGGLANQNRGTLGGNIANASPAADSLPALLCYGADLVLVSVRGERRIPYRIFHTGYKKMLLEPDELIHSIVLQRRFLNYFSYSRKAGARKAQAISKVSIAALAQKADGCFNDVRIALASVAPIPIRLTRTEQFLSKKSPEASLALGARKIALAEIAPIDDIRSTARYRATVVGNFVAEFVTELCRAPEGPFRAGQ